MNTQLDGAKYSQVASSGASRVSKTVHSVLHLTLLVLYTGPHPADSFVAGNLGGSDTVSFKEPR